MTSDVEKIIQPRPVLSDPVRVEFDGELCGYVGRTESGWCYLRYGLVFGYFAEEQAAIARLVELRDRR